MLETSAFQIFHRGHSTFINLFDKTKFSRGLEFFQATIFLTFCEILLSCPFLIQSFKCLLRGLIIIIIIEY